MYNYYMELDAKEIIKVLLNRENMKQKVLAEMLTDKTGKTYTQGSLSQKINRGTISYNEMLLIADILGYKINIEKSS